MSSPAYKSHTTGDWNMHDGTGRCDVTVAQLAAASSSVVRRSMLAFDDCCLRQINPACPGCACGEQLIDGISGLLEV
jgi:hypothetical protein